MAGALPRGQLDARVVLGARRRPSSSSWASPAQHAYFDYRRWAVESAALDLALRQAGTALGAALGRDAAPVRFVSSNGRWASWRKLYPELHFKLDPTPEWTDDQFAELESLDVVEVADLKGAYHGTTVDNPANPALYGRVLDAFPRSWIEDPDSDARDGCAPRAASRPGDMGRPDPLVGRRRIAPVRPALPELASLRASAPSPGSSSSTTAAPTQEIALYGGGQFELGIGRTQIQLLAALFHPDGWNDVAPAEFNDPEPRSGLPGARSQLVLEPGFRAHARGLAAGSRRRQTGRNDPCEQRHPTAVPKPRVPLPPRHPTAPKPAPPNGLESTQER